MSAPIIATPTSSNLQVLEDACAHFVRSVAASRPPGDIGFAVVFFPKNAPEIGVTGSNCSPELLAKVFHKAEKRCKSQRIVGPEGVA